MSAIDVTICCLSGEVLATVECQSTSTVEQLKLVICDMLSVPQEHLCLLQLVHSETVLNDNSLIGDVTSQKTCRLTLLRAQSSRLGALPEFCGSYIGIEEEEIKGFTLRFEVVIDSADWIELSATDEDGDCQVEGVIHFRIVSVAGDVVGHKEFASRWNDNTLRSREFVRGLLHADGMLTVAGYAVEPRTGMIDTASYEFTLAEDGSSIAGAFDGWEEDVGLQLRKMTNEETLAWRDDRRSDMRVCTHHLADEVRKANGVSEVDPNRVVAEEPLDELVGACAN